VAWERGRPREMYYFGLAPGDDLLCTAVLRELAARQRKHVWMMSNHPQLFAGNADVAQVVPVDERFHFYTTLRGGKYQRLEYATVDLARDLGVQPSRHIIAELCLRAGVTGTIAVRPYFFPTEAEKAQAAWAGGVIAIQSSGLASKYPMRNKQWFAERFQEVVDGLKKECKFVQLGSPSDPPLDGVVDLRGKTGLRETAAVLANCRLYLGNVGFLMHLARAVECPAVIIYGGREAPWQSGYTCNANLYSAEPCAPCWFWNKCDFNRICMDKISANQVIGAIHDMRARPRNPLAVDSYTI